MCKNNPHFNFHALMVKLFFSLLVISFAVLSCRQSEPNPVLGAWLPDSNIHSRIVFSEKMYIYSRGKVREYNYRINESGRKLITQDSTGHKRVYIISFFENYMTIEESKKNVTLLIKSE